MAAFELKERIYRKSADLNHVSFAELAEIDGFRGDYEMGIQPNIIL